MYIIDENILCGSDTDKHENGAKYHGYEERRTERNYHGHSSLREEKKINSQPTY